ncbi:hypothetical protein ABW20_dc0102690 [Dactylellina cionopaga]|nr:hypothetical protein ABW20_dc0102690 [Dactylellina cionopaga]
MAKEWQVHGNSATKDEVKNYTFKKAKEGMVPAAKLKQDQRESLLEYSIRVKIIALAVHSISRIFSDVSDQYAARGFNDIPKLADQIITTTLSTNAQVASGRENLKLYRANAQRGVGEIIEKMTQAPNSPKTRKSNNQPRTTKARKKLLRRLTQNPER